MDTNMLREQIKATLDNNADTRRQAELNLKHAEEQPGFPSALLNILQTDTEHAIRLSAVVYLKNRVNRGWAASDAYPTSSLIPENEKTPFREGLVPILANSNSSIRAQLIPILQKILHFDFPQKWPNFLDVTIQLLTTNDANSVNSGLLCLLALCRVYRYKAGDNRGDFDKIVEVTFPQLLTIGNGLLNETSAEAGEMLRLVMKAYKHAIQFELPTHLATQESMVAWCSLFLRVVAHEVPPSAMMEDLEEREWNHWWKSKKWAYANLNRLFVRYGNPGAMANTEGENYTEFSKNFITNFAPEILKSYLGQVEKWVAKTAWLSKPCLSSTLTFLDECVKPQATWAHLKPHVDTLISHVIFPILCPSDDDIEQFESEPQDYLHQKLNCYEEISAPDIAATTFLNSLTKSRKKQTFSIINFVNGVVNRYEAAPEEEKNPREKDGALRMISTLASVILAKNSPIADAVEFFFVQHVFPEFNSKHGFLRARACDTIEKFESLQFKDQDNLIVMYRHVLAAMADPDLPVRVQASLALQTFIQHDVIRETMRQNIPQIMQQLLRLSNEVDVDSLANVMEEFVEVFATELTPFAVALTEQLRDTYLRIIRDLLERNSAKADPDDGYGDYFDDKAITALGVLQTIGTLILTLESTPDVLLHLETILMPIIQITLDNKLYDLYNEVFEIIDSCTFSAKSISPTMWQAFALLHKTFQSGAELYLEDMLPALDNFIQYGSQSMLQDRQYLEAVVSIIDDIFLDEKVGGVERICGCKLAEALMLNLQGSIDGFIPRFIELAMTHLTNQEAKVKSHKIHLLEMVINTIYYSPALSLHILESKNWTNKFFSLWFSNIDNFTRVHDKKLSIAAISALLSLRAEEVPQSVQQGWPRLLQGIARLFQTLPAALKNREDATKEADFPADEPSVEDEEDEWDETANWEEADEPETDVAVESQAYLNFLHDEAQKFQQGPPSEEDYDDQLEEESLLETPLDKVEPYSLFRAALLQLQLSQPQLYDDLTKNLTPDEQAVVRAAVQQAENIAAQQQQEQQQQQQQQDFQQQQFAAMLQQQQAAVSPQTPVQPELPLTTGQDGLANGTKQQ